MVLRCAGLWCAVLSVCRSRKPKGYCFVEFADAESLRVHLSALQRRSCADVTATRGLTLSVRCTALCSALLCCAVVQRGLLLHGSELLSRRINCELTAGGGGAKSAHRKQKIEAKNAALTEERRRRAAAAAAAKAATNNTGQQGQAEEAAATASEATATHEGEALEVSSERSARKRRRKERRKGRKEDSHAAQPPTRTFDDGDGVAEADIH